MNRIIKLYTLFKSDIAMLFFAILNGKTPRKIKIGMIMALLYLISPVDIVPDTLPVIGVLDDAVLVPMAVMMLTNMLPESVKQDCANKAWKYEKWLPIIMGAAALIALSMIFMMFYGLFKLIFG